jgi:hypothetical protein
MLKLSDLAVRTLTPPGYRFSSGVVQAVAVQGAMLVDNVVDFEVNKLPRYREALENDLLQLNDVVIGTPGYPRELTAVGIYHSALPCPEPVTLASGTLAFRARNLIEAVSILAALIYRLARRRSPLEFNEVRGMPVELLTEEQVPKFLELLKITHEMHVNARKRQKLMQELVPATVQKFYKDIDERRERNETGAGSGSGSDLLSTR